jgi:hypothetical protein
VEMSQASRATRREAREAGRLSELQRKARPAARIDGSYLQKRRKTPMAKILLLGLFFFERNNEWTHKFHVTNVILLLSHTRL